MYMNKIAAVDNLLPDCSEKLGKEGFILRLHFVLWNFDCNLASSFSSKVVLSGKMERLAQQNNMQP